MIPIKNTKNLKCLVYALLVFFILGSCTSSRISKTEKGPSLPISTSTTGIVTEMPMPTITNTDMPTLPWTSSPTNIPPTLGSTPTLTPFPPTLTPLPSLSPNDAQNMFEGLLQTNGNCQLPCWWGITPGETSWPEAQQSLATFVDHIGPGEERWITEDGVSFLSSNYSISFLQDDGNLKRCALISLNNYEVEEIYIQDLCTSSVYLGLENILNRQGPPDEIRFVIQRYLDSYRVSFGFLYSNHRIFVSYGDATARSTEGVIHACLSSEPAAVILRAPEMTLKYEDIFDELALESYMALSELEMDEKEFHEYFTNPSNAPCVDIPESVLE